LADNRVGGLKVFIELQKKIQNDVQVVLIGDIIK